MNKNVTQQQRATYIVVFNPSTILKISIRIMNSLKQS